MATLIVESIQNCHLSKGSFVFYISKPPAYFIEEFTDLQCGPINNSSPFFLGPALVLKTFRIMTNVEIHPDPQ